MKSFAGLLLLVTYTLAAQEPAPVFKSKSELVLVPVVVTRDGQPVVGLKVADFVLVHQGHHENVAVFEEIERRVTPAQRLNLPANVTANFGNSDAQADTVIVLLDFLNAQWENAANIRAYTHDFAKLFAETNTRVAFLLLTTKGLVQIHSFSSDPANLYNAVDAWAKKKPIGPKDEIITGPSSWASTYDVTSMTGTIESLDHLAFSPNIAEILKLDRAVMTTQAIEQISLAFGGIPGRKRLIWVSTGFPNVGDINTRESSARYAFQLHDGVVRAWHALTTNNIAVYPIDSNGGPVNPLFDRCRLPNTASMLEVAARTGGRTCVDTLKDCMARTLAADHHYYLLGFYLRGEQKPGWHKLKVQLSGHEANIRTRSGFLVQDDKAVPTDVEKEVVLAALASPLDYTGVPLTLRSTLKIDKDNARVIELSITSPPGGLQIDGSTGHVSLDFLAFVRPVGKVDGQSYPASIRTTLTVAQQKTVTDHGFAYRKEVPISPGNYEIRVFLRDNQTGRIGTVSTSMSVH